MHVLVVIYLLYLLCYIQDPYGILLRFQRLKYTLMIQMLEKRHTNYLWIS